MSANQVVITNPYLERAMDAVAKNDSMQSRESLYRAILASTLIVPGAVSGDSRAFEGGSVAGAGTRVAFRTIEHPSGNVILPAFTTVDALVSFAGSEVQWVGLGAQALFQSILPGNIAEVRINPFRTGQQLNKPGGIVTRREFTALAQGLTPQGAISDNVARLGVAQNQVIIGRPQNEPAAEVIERLAAYFRQFPDFKDGYLFQMGDQNTSSTVIGLEVVSMPVPQRMEPIMRGAGAILQAALPPGQFIDFMPLVPGSLLEAVRKSGRLLFQK